MKILLLNKNANKPKSLSFYSLSILIAVIFSIGFLSAFYFLKNQHKQETMDIDLVSIEEDKLGLSTQELELYISQIGELNARIMQLDSQSERIQEIMKSQILGKDKLPALKEKKIKMWAGHL